MKYCRSCSIQLPKIDGLEYCSSFCARHLDGIFCLDCGNKLSSDGSFCMKCNKIEEWKK